MRSLDNLRIDRSPVALATETHFAHDLCEFHTNVHFHDEYQFVVLLQGERLFQSRGRILRLQAGESLIIPPREPHSGLSIGKEKATFRTVYVPRDLLTLSGVELFLSRPGLFRFDQPRLGELIEELAAQSMDSTSRPKIIGSLVSIAQQVSPPKSDTVAERCSEALSNVREALENSIEIRPSLEPLARMCGMSKYHMVRAFANIYGLPPYAYNVRHRVNIARKRLAAGQALCEVALELGFYDQSHFGFHFRTLTGLSPGAYQRKVLKRYEA